MAFCHPASPLRPGLLHVIDGAPLADHPDLKVAVAKLAAISTVERDIDAKHALAGVRVALGKHYRSLLCSLALRLPEVKLRLNEDPQLLVDLGSCVDAVPRAPGKLMVVLNLAEH